MNVNVNVNVNVKVKVKVKVDSTAFGGAVHRIPATGREPRALSTS